MRTFDIPGPERREVENLFRGVSQLRAVVDSALDGHLGKAKVDDRGAPTVASLELGCYTILGGDPFLPTTRTWVETLDAPRELLFPDSDDWRALLREVHGPALTERPMQAFSAEDLSSQHLTGMAAPPPGVELRRIDAGIAARLDEELEPHALQVFESPADFAKRGIGFAAVQEGNPICVATSYSFCQGAIELAIATHPTHRGRGLAKSVAATLILYCLEREITPHWNASNPVSQRLAQSLGYRPDGICEVLYLETNGVATIR